MRTPHPRPFLPSYILPETCVGGYVVKYSIGEGGGQVAYLATDSDGYEVVLKVCRAPEGARKARQQDQHERFLRQVTYFLQLRGVRGVARVFAHDTYRPPWSKSKAGYPYMVQEWISGGVNILDWYRHKPRPLKAIVGCFALLANACGEMDRRGICNRDLKPSNILMAPIGHGIPKIVDFDSGMSVGAPELTSTGPGRWPGTKLYYSPEVCRAILTDLEKWSRTRFQYQPAQDLHALGVIFYEVLTGEHPFDGTENDEELFLRIANETPRRPRALNPEVPFGLDKITMKLLRKDPARRYKTGDDLADDLGALLATEQDWDRPFKTPAKDRHDSSSSRPSTTRTTSWPLASRGYTSDSSRTSDGSAAFDLEPAAIVLAGPHALAVRGSRALLRLEPAPSALVCLTPRPAVRPPAPRRWARLLMAALAVVIVAVVVWLFVGQRGAASSHSEGKLMALGKVKATVAVAVSSVITACTGLTGNLRSDEKDFLEHCPPKARKVVADLELPPDAGMAVVLKGENALIPFWGGLEVRNGPVTVSAIFPTPRGSVVGHLFGEIRTDSEGASLRFTKLKVANGSEGRNDPPAGPEHEICAIASARDGAHASLDFGIPKATNPLRPQDLHPGFLFVTTGELHIHFAH